MFIYSQVFFFFFLFFFLYHVLLVKVQELACIVRYGVKKNLIPNNRPLHLLMGTIKHPESIGKNPPRLAPKRIIPQTRKETIHRDVQERDPNPSAGSPKTKERIDREGPTGPEGEDE